MNLSIMTARFGGYSVTQFTGALAGATLRLNEIHEHPFLPYGIFAEHSSSPHVGFSQAILRISFCTSSGNRGLPRGLDFHRQSRRKPRRCQPRNVSGLTLTKAVCQAKRRESKIIDRRIASVARRGLTSRSR